ncbi:MAG TPA: CbiX/SirB N-terminal domain-containing protein [Gemmatimonadaceae bacterium]|nr:CbiX/SirB N-terminal domain-containing protein [Gemmatimonadaceae bacterium]
MPTPNASSAVFRAVLGAAFIAALLPPASAAQSPKVGTIVVAHGADREWNAPVEALAASLLTAGPVRVAFLMGEGAKTLGFAEAARQLEALGVQQIVVVPLLVSSHSAHYMQIRWLAGLIDSIDARLAEHMHHMGVEPAKVRVPIRVAPALDDATELGDVLAERASALAKSPREQALFLVAHGPNDAEEYALWMENLRRVAERVREKAGFRDVRVDAVRDDAPAPVRAEAVRRVRELITLQQAATQHDVVVVPILISRGKMTRSTLVKDLEGLPIEYSGAALLPHPALARWAEAQVREAPTRAP